MSTKLVCASLETLWWGVSIGGKHYTGEIKISSPYQKIEMIRKLSRKEAKELHGREGRMWLSYPTETNKFDTLKQLENHATKWCQKNLGENWVLFDGDELNPSRVISAKGWITRNVDMMNEMAAAWDKVPNSQRDWSNPVIAGFYDVWKDMFKELID